MKSTSGIRRNLAGAVLVIAVSGFLVALPFIAKDSYNRLLFIQVMINVIVVVGLNFITGLAGQMNLGTAGIFALGAYTSALLTTRLGASAWLGLAAAILMGFIVGRGLGYPSLRVKGVYLALTTIGFGEIVRMFLTNFSDFTGGIRGVNDIPAFKLFGIDFREELHMYFLYLAISAVLLLVAHYITNSKWGRVFKGVRDNPEACEASGIDISSIKILAFTLATIYASIGGVMYAHCFGYINPNAFNMNLSINYLVMLILGGVGSVPGCLLGTAAITLLPEYLRFLQNYYWLIFSVITLIFVIFRPEGIISFFPKPASRASGAGSDHGKNGDHT